MASDNPVGSGANKHAGLPRQAIRIRLHPDTAERVRYWADSEGLSVNEYVALATEEKIQRANGDYNLPVLEVQRLNQMIDEVKALSINVTNLELVTVNGFDSLLGLTRGDSYLQDAEDGELGEVSLVDFDVDIDEVRAGFGGGQ